jgi:hypothetical protein
LNNSKTDELYIHIPTSLKNKIDRAFANVSQLQRNKIYFLIWKINIEGRYQVNIRNFVTLFGLKGGQVTSLLEKLRSELIINTDGDYAVGYRSNTYFLTNPYNKVVDKNKDFQILYKSDVVSVPTWVKRYCADNSYVVSKKNTNFETKNKGKVSEHTKLQDEIKRLQQLLIDNNIPFEELNMAKPLIYDNTAIQASPSTLSSVELQAPTTEIVVPSIEANEPKQESKVSLPEVKKYKYDKSNDQYFINSNGNLLIINSASTLIDYFELMENDNSKFVKEMISTADLNCLTHVVKDGKNGYTLKFSVEKNVPNNCHYLELIGVKAS